MPTLDWLNRAQAFTTSARVPYRLLEEVSVHLPTAKPETSATEPVASPAHLLNDPYEIEKRQIGELWARKSENRCLFGQIVKERDGLGMSGQLNALLA